MRYREPSGTLLPPGSIHAGNELPGAGSQGRNVPALNEGNGARLKILEGLLWGVITIHTETTNLITLENKYSPRTISGRNLLGKKAPSLENRRYAGPGRGSLVPHVFQVGSRTSPGQIHGL
ncbi:MAG TPA: hypothetical protein P5536_03830 [Methanoregulaceae archaeon]|nr:MAG: hypothetical protein IPI71_08115 [Methanolinea sp.]HRT15186.1 hypothetical protein [Methanoregulaceae archaeon]